MLFIKNLSKIYYNKKTKENFSILKKITFSLPKKGFVFILGKTGSGKTTLMNILGGLDNYNHGEIIFKNKSTKEFSQKDFNAYRNTSIGFIFQDYKLLEDFTVFQNISISLELQNQKFEQSHIKNILKKLDLEGLENRYIKELSGGQKQRVAIARAIIKNPEIILGDEVTGALDSQTGKNILDILKEISKEKLVVLVSHDIENTYAYADRVIEIQDGNIFSDKVNKKENIFQNDLALDNADSYLAIKSRLPFKIALRIALNNIKSKPVNLFFNIFLMVMSLVFLGVSLCFSFYNKSDIAKYTFKNNTYIPLIISPKNKDFYNKPNYPDFKNENEVEEFKNKYPNAHFQNVYTYKNNADLFMSKNPDLILYLNPKINFVVIDKKDINFWNNIGVIKPKEEDLNTDYNYFVSKYIFDKIPESLRYEKLKSFALSKPDNRFDDVLNLSEEEIKKIGEDFMKNIVKIVSLSLNRLDKDEGINSLCFIDEKQFTKNKAKFKLKSLIGNAKDLKEQQLTEIVKMHYDNVYSNLSLQNIPAISFIDGSEPIFKKLSLFLLFLSINYSIFSFILIFNFISNSIQKRIKEVGILKALGANNFDISTIFTIEVCILAIINLLLSFGLIKTIIWYGNKMISNLIWVNLVSFNFTVMKIIFLITFLVMFLATFFPIWKISRKKPIEIIIQR
ncbi:ABC transporter ATP-binding protein/permease [Candidatus Phytoplasma luffae]|uniref:ABC transporter ATP-binding protein/permease n=1 Tax=Loofah witches'-broom phytoplasma TaxID=35773 RepID=A0A975FIS7_LOWBP|nr:ABC transporter ATP-binding protein/permease [Candidatus Phytoplasma luffae]QTX02620.1 ABC transporter ATP-binding protein/permease [Candidatus Phytoplasma luffae]